ncbi:unnamed protein product [Closterium sp. Yama58-4]|nr:unnamed protein product [Closterium sp. Yama58-4]
MLPNRAIIASQFWNHECGSAQSLEAVVPAVPHEPPSTGIHLGSGIARSQQLLLLQKLLPIPFTPSYAADVDDQGGWVVDRVLSGVGGRDWWATVMGRLRVQRMWRKHFQQQTNARLTSDSAHTAAAALASAAAATENTTGSSSSSRAKGYPSSSSGWFQDPTMYALSARTRIALGKQTWLSGSAELSTLAGLAAALQGKMMGRQRREGGAVAGSEEGGGERGGEASSFRGFVSLRHKMKGHDLIARAGWGEQCVDRAGRYWTLPRALSLDFASLVTREGLRYRFGLQHVGGKPEVRPEVPFETTQTSPRFGLQHVGTARSAF